MDKKALRRDIASLRDKLPGLPPAVQSLTQKCVLHLESEIANAGDSNAHLRAGTLKALDALEAAVRGAQ